MKLYSIIPCIAAHSWIACTDYAEKNGAYYDDEKCRGWPRLASQFAPIGGTFGGDKGYDTRPQFGTSPCASLRSTEDYSGGHHEAVYFPGQQVVLAHPMKNHGAASCTNKYIPDHGNWLYAQPMTSVGDTDPTLGQFKQNEIVNLGKSPVGHEVPDSTIDSYPKQGFQNAPAFCEDTDKSLGTYSFNVPDNMESGKYTFVWLWAFNGPKDYYSTCFEVTIAKGAKERNDILLSRNQHDLSLPCDSGPTSNGTPGSLKGCSDDNGLTPQTTKNVPKSTTEPSLPLPTVTHPSQKSSAGYVLANQMSGQMILPGPDEPPKRREIHVKFNADCAEVARPNFWYARLDRKHNKEGQVTNRFRRSNSETVEEVHYVLIQDNEDDIRRGVVGFHWSFDGGCRILDYPSSLHVIDTV